MGCRRRMCSRRSLGRWRGCFRSMWRASSATTPTVCSPTLPPGARQSTMFLQSAAGGCSAAITSARSGSRPAARPGSTTMSTTPRGPASYVVRKVGYDTAVGAPVIVEGHLWGLIGASSTLEQPLPPDTEARLASFTELVATAIANADSRAELMASRARIVAAADDTRRRIERDLHDGTQQQLVSLMLELRAVQAALPPQSVELRGELSRIAERAKDVFDQVREISHGIHPAILSESGLTPALKALARRSAVPVELDLRSGRRLPGHVEVAAYYAVSEALANAAKHAHASAVQIELDTPDTVVRLAIRDDGIGGADPAQGSGLTGLRDRIEALGGTLEVTSPAGSGTTLLIEIPV